MCWITPATPWGNSLSDMVVFSLTLQVPFLTHHGGEISPQLSAFSLGGMFYCLKGNFRPRVLPPSVFLALVSPLSS